MTYWSSLRPADHYLAAGQARINAISRAGGTAPGFNDVILLSHTGKGRTTNLTLALSAPINDWGLGWRVGYTYGESTDVNSGVDAIANSSWEGRPSFNVNEDVATTSNFEIKERGIGSVSYGKEFFAGAATTISLFAELRQGRAFSYGYIDDANGDRVAGNDLFYREPLETPCAVRAQGARSDCRMPEATEHRATRQSDRAGGF